MSLPLLSVSGVRESLAVITPTLRFLRACFLCSWTDIRIRIPILDGIISSSARTEIQDDSRFQPNRRFISPENFTDRRRSDRDHLRRASYRRGTWLTNALDWIRGLGALAPVAFITIYIVACVAFLPGSMLTIGAGVIFGVRARIDLRFDRRDDRRDGGVPRRALSRARLGQRKTRRQREVHAIDQAVGREGWKIVLLTRLSPVFPFNLLNYAFGLTR